MSGTLVELVCILLVLAGALFAGKMMSGVALETWTDGVYVLMVALVLSFMWPVARAVLGSTVLKNMSPMKSRIASALYWGLGGGIVLFVGMLGRGWEESDNMAVAFFLVFVALLFWAVFLPMLKKISAKVKQLFLNGVGHSSDWSFGARALLSGIKSSDEKSSLWRLKKLNRETVLVHLTASLVWGHLFVFLIVIAAYYQGLPEALIPYWIKGYFCFCLLLMFACRIYSRLMLRRKLRVFRTGIMLAVLLAFGYSVYAAFWGAYPPAFEQRGEYFYALAIAMVLLDIIAFANTKYNFSATWFGFPIRHRNIVLDDISDYMIKGILFLGLFVYVLKWFRIEFVSNLYALIERI